MLLIAPPKETVYGKPMAPRLGLAYLSAKLKEENISHSILDLKLYNNWQGKLRKAVNNHHIFGISSTSFEFSSAKKVARKIKEFNENSKTIIGGPHATILKNEILKEDCFDFCVAGEGENILPDLVDKIKLNAPKRKFFQGVRLSEDELDDLPFPNYENFDKKMYSGFPNVAYVISSRGCPFNCIFCNIKDVMGREFRARSPENVVDELSSMKEKYGVNYFRFQDDNFTADPERTKKICREIQERELNIEWSLNARADILNNELVKKMKNAGCREIDIGIESTKDEILNNLNKNESFSDIKKAVRIIKENKLKVKGYFVIGSPGERKEDVLDYLDFAIKWLDKARFALLVPYPGTELHKWIDENNYWCVDNPEKQILTYTDIGKTKALFETPEFTKKEREEVYEEVTNKWEKYKARSSIKNWAKYNLSRFPRVYNKARKLYEVLRR